MCVVGAGVSEPEIKLAAINDTIYAYVIISRMKSIYRSRVKSDEFWMAC